MRHGLNGVHLIFHAARLGATNRLTFYFGTVAQNARRKSDRHWRREYMTMEQGHLKEFLARLASIGNSWEWVVREKGTRPGGKRGIWKHNHLEGRVLDQAH